LEYKIYKRKRGNMTVRRMTPQDNIANNPVCPICKYSIYGQYADPERYLQGPITGIFCRFFCIKGIDFSSGVIEENIEWRKEDLCEGHNKEGQCLAFKRDQDKYMDFYFGKK
jgi:hypothetical protein